MAMLILCAVPAVVFILLVCVGYGIFRFLLNTIPTLNEWADRQIRLIDEWQEEEE